MYPKNRKLFYPQSKLCLNGQRLDRKKCFVFWGTTRTMLPKQDNIEFWKANFLKTEQFLFEALKTLESRKWDKKKCLCLSFFFSFAFELLSCRHWHSRNATSNFKSGISRLPYSKSGRFLLDGAKTLNIIQYKSTWQNRNLPTSEAVCRNYLSSWFLHASFNSTAWLNGEKSAFSYES